MSSEHAADFRRRLGGRAPALAAGNCGPSSGSSSCSFLRGSRTAVRRSKLIGKCDRTSGHDELSKERRVLPPSGKVWHIPGAKGQRRRADGHKPIRGDGTAHWPMNTIDDAVDGWRVRLAHFRAPSQRSDLGQTTQQCSEPVQQSVCVPPAVDIERSVVPLQHRRFSAPGPSRRSSQREPVHRRQRRK
jgi:hypothetical protein